MAETNDVPASLAKWTLLSILAMMSAACIGAGGIFYGWIVADHLRYNSPFSGFQMLDWILGLMASGVVMVGLVLAGILLRFLPWSRAPLASLCLAVVSTGFILATYLVFSDTGNGSDSLEVLVLMACCIMLLSVVALPPFLYWWNAPGPKA